MTTTPNVATPTNVAFGSLSIEGRDGEIEAIGTLQLDLLMQACQADPTKFQNLVSNAMVACVHRKSGGKFAETFGPARKTRASQDELIAWLTQGGISGGKVTKSDTLDGPVADANLKVLQASVKAGATLEVAAATMSRIKGHTIPATLDRTEQMWASARNRAAERAQTAAKKAAEEAQVKADLAQAMADLTKA